MYTFKQLDTYVIQMQKQILLALYLFNVHMVNLNIDLISKSGNQNNPSTLISNSKSINYCCIPYYTPLGLSTTFGYVRIFIYHINTSCTLNN